MFSNAITKNSNVLVILASVILLGACDLTTTVTNAGSISGVNPDDQSGNGTGNDSVDPTNGGGTVTVDPPVDDTTAPPAGAKPSAANTGPNKISLLSSDVSALVNSGSIAVDKAGTLTVLKAGTQIENLDWTGHIVVCVDNVSFKNFRLRMNGTAALNGNYGITSHCNRVTHGILYQDGEIDGKGVASTLLYGTGFTAVRMNLHHSGADAIKAETDVILEDSYIHNLGMIALSHADGVQMVEGSDSTFTGNNFDIPAGSDVYRSNSAFIIKTDSGNISNIRIQSNWMNGGNCTLQIGSGGNGIPTGVSVIDNMFGRDTSSKDCVLKYWDAGLNYVWTQNHWMDDSNGNEIPKLAKPN